MTDAAEPHEHQCSEIEIADNADNAARKPPAKTKI
jgi:hypothetical protein